MGIAPFGSYIDNRLPDRPLLEVNTKKEWADGGMRNGVHIPHQSPIEVYLDVFIRRFPKPTCRDCGRQIEYGEVVGDASYRGRGMHCINCLALPEGIIEAWRFTYPMKRKSRKNPTGKKYVYVVNFASAIKDYVALLDQSFSGYLAEKLWSSADLPPVDDTCKTCDGSGEVAGNYSADDGVDTCPDCGGKGHGVISEEDEPSNHINDQA